LADANAAAEINPSNPGAFAIRGAIYTDMSEFDRAQSELNKAVQLGPTYSPGFGYLGALYLKLQQYDKAIDVFTKALAISPRTVNYLSGRGAAYMNVSENEKALADLNAAISLNPRTTRVLVNRGRLYIDMGNTSAAIADLSDVLTREPKNVYALLPRAKAYEQSGNLVAAKADYQTVLDIVPAHGVASAGRDRIDNKIAAASGAPRPAQDHAGVRVALVIGNSHYKAVDTLANPERDAKLIADSLRRSGFEKVNLIIDGARVALIDALKAFSQAAANADWAVVYFAGHGIEFDGSNYLVPVDVKYENDDDIPKESLALDQVLNSVAGASKLRLVILDACRENPFVSELNKGDGSAVGRGLARIEPESGTLVAFATKHGYLATDGNGNNSPFATALANRIAIPGLEISQLFRLVHDDVYASTAKQQEPFTYGQLPAERFYFRAQ
jgi:tetratricopeptide (TPR) repeat protein